MSTLIIFILACGLPSPAVTEEAAEPTPIPDLPKAHQVIPGELPIDRSSHAGDFDSSTSAAQKASAGGDRFTFGHFERPFNANTMDTYFPEIDIVDTAVFQDETWIYGKITLKGNESRDLNGKYAVELDTDLDGKGDWLITASAPLSTDWKTEGVEIHQDVNEDVGSVSPMYTDENTSGDGFETVIFDEENGADPDSAWARISPEDPNAVEFSIKRSVVNYPEKYLINMWAGNSLLDPILFDINDHYTHEQAGAADPGFEIFYPIKDVAEIDNSCRMAVGFQPTGQEPGLCEVFVPNAPGASPEGCNATPTQVLACSLSADPSYSCSWNKRSCSCECEYVGPK